MQLRVPVDVGFWRLKSADPPTPVQQSFGRQRPLVAGSLPFLLPQPGPACCAYTTLQAHARPAGTAAAAAAAVAGQPSRPAAAPEPVVGRSSIQWAPDEQPPHSAGPAAGCRRLVGAGGDAAAMLLRDPALVYSVQRGSRSLGPGAEF